MCVILFEEGENVGFAHDSQVTGFEVQPVLQVKNVSRRFGGVQALDNVSMELLPGEIHALVGENGAGKSTLVKILTGLDQPDSGDILVNGVRRYLVSSHIARQLGLVAMYQEPIIFPDLDVAENIYAGRFPRTKNGTISWQEVYARAEALFERIGINPGVRTSARDLSVASRQLVEIARALSNNAIVLLMDEPTAVLSQKETGRLFDIVRNLRSQGLTIIFISHRINEIKELADRVTIIRNGTVVTTKTLEDTTEHDIIELMVGRDVNENSKPMPRTITDEVLSIKGLTRFGIFEDVSLTVRAGEIVGLAGFVGAGRSEVARSLFGVDHVDKGEVRLGGELFQPRSPRDAIHRGLAYVPENRLIQGIFPIMTSGFNIVIPACHNNANVTKLTSEIEAMDRSISPARITGARPSARSATTACCCATENRLLKLKKYGDMVEAHTKVITTSINSQNSHRRITPHVSSARNLFIAYLHLLSGFSGRY